MSFILYGIRCSGDSSFGGDDYVVFEYGVLVPLWNSSSIVVGGCKDSESKNWVLRLIACFTPCKIISGLTASSWRIVSPKRFIKSLMDLDLPIRKWKRLVTLYFLLTEHMY